MKRKRTVEGKVCACSRPADRYHGSAYVCAECAKIEAEMNKWSLGIATKRQAKRHKEETCTIQEFNDAFRAYCERTGMKYFNETRTLSHDTQ